MFKVKRRDPSDVDLDLLRKLRRDAYQMLTGMISVTAHLWASAFFNERLVPKRRRARRKREPIRCCPSNHDEYLRWIDSCRTATLVRSGIRGQDIQLDRRAGYFSDQALRTKCSSFYKTAIVLPRRIPCHYEGRSTRTVKASELSGECETSMMSYEMYDAKRFTCRCLLSSTTSSEILED